MASQPLKHLTEEEYLEMQRNTEFRYEFMRGDVFPMESVTGRHAQIHANIGGIAFHQALRQGCRLYTNPMVWVTATGLYTFADLIILCGPPQYKDERGEQIVNPRVIFEILSKSTANYDLGEKFESYRTIPSFVEYITVEQKCARIGQRVRQDDGSWLMRYYSGKDSVARLASFECELPLVQVYEGVEFD